MTILHPDLELALKGFVPVFGNTDDIAIDEMLGRLVVKLRTVDNERFRDAQAGKKGVHLTKKMIEIQRDETSLINLIRRRNFDF